MMALKDSSFHKTSNIHLLFYDQLILLVSQTLSKLIKQHDNKELNSVLTFKLERQLQIATSRRLQWEQLNSGQVLIK